MAFGQWLRESAERYLLQAASDEMISQYPGCCAKPYRDGQSQSFFWRKIFVPAYLIIPWSLRRRLIIYSSYSGRKRPQWKKYT